ncbi:hypothetical protein GE061_002396 [Apolygus lucorum]|uniref:Uncharacterized protein n=1 Tax=Apolygus lucorum TaxID=248454 RepID=A0A6A4JPJ1_APOLU|nr:hypothetical protein GE061_002396 [Apolygus lucorum]
MLTTPTQNEASGSGMSSPPQIPGAPVRLSRLTFDDVVDRNRSMMLREGHMKRLKNLKKELEYIQETSWKYSPIETFIGH